MLSALFHNVIACVVFLATSGRLTSRFSGLCVALTAFVYSRFNDKFHTSIGHSDGVEVVILDRKL